MKVLVTGATGFLGQHLTRRLLADGHAVYVLGRDFSRLDPLLTASTTAICTDLSDEEAVRRACEGIDAVYHVGALSAAWGRRTQFYASNVRGTRAVIDGCLEHRVRRLIYVSSPSVVFDGRDVENATEQAPYPRHFVSLYSLTKKLGEDMLREVAGQLETVIVRPKAIFGPGDRTLLPQLLALARRGRLPQIGEGKNLVDLTYVENVVHALLLALDAREAVGNTYTITNDEHVSLWDEIRLLLGQLNLSTHLRKISLPAALSIAALMEAGASITGKQPLLTRYTVAILARTQTYDIGAARRDLGYVPQVSIAEGIERTLAALRSEL